MRCAAPDCPSRAVHFHHVVYRQHIRGVGGDVDDPRAVMPLCFSCHGDHHARCRVLPRSCLPAAAVEFAHEVLGAWADDYLARRYA
jgi:hypothetical protein